jgi:hypothetical protein
MSQFPNRVSPVRVSPSLPGYAWIWNGRRGPRIQVWPQLRMRTDARWTELGQWCREHPSRRQINLQRQQLHQPHCNWSPAVRHRLLPRRLDLKTATRRGRRRLFPLRQWELGISARHRSVATTTAHSRQARRHALLLQSDSARLFHLSIRKFLIPPLFRLQDAHNLVTDCNILFNFISNSSVNGQLNSSNRASSSDYSSLVELSTGGNVIILSLSHTL